MAAARSKTPNFYMLKFDIFSFTPESWTHRISNHPSLPLLFVPLPGLHSTGGFPRVFSTRIRQMAIVPPKKRTDLLVRHFEIDFLKFLSGLVPPGRWVGLVFKKEIFIF